MDKQIIFSLHGIRTRGAWQKTLDPALSRAGFTPVPLDYGLFGALGLLVPSKRRARVEWFRDQYTRHVQSSSTAPSIVAHSLGAYIFADALLRFPELKFDQVILCGSIVSRAYPWSSVILEGRVNRVLNDYGSKDIWARVAEWVVKDAGQSGLRGFKDDADQRVIQRVHPTWRHSDFFYELNYERNWIPFLKGGPIPDARPLPATGVNWRFGFVMSLLLVAIAAGIFYASKYVRPFFSPTLVVLDLVQDGPWQYALIQRVHSSKDHRYDLEGGRYDASRLFIAAIVGQQATCGTTLADNQYIPSFHPGAAMTIEGSQLLVFFITKDQSRDFKVNGAVYVVDKGTLRAVEARELFEGKNWGWFPRYESPNRIVHFDYDKYSEMVNTDMIGRVQPETMSAERDKWMAAHSGGKLPAQNISDVFTHAAIDKIKKACNQ